MKLATRLLTRWWGSGDSNPDVFRHQILSLARLPVPALPQRMQHYPKQCCIRFIPPLKTLAYQIPKTIRKYQKCIPKYTYFSSGWGYNPATDDGNETPLFALSLTTSSLAPLTLPEYMVEVLR